MGFDLCSPERNKTSDNRPCHSPCREEEGGERHYKCHTSHDMTVKDHCGNWDVTEFTTKALEYDDKDRVGYNRKQYLDSRKIVNLKVCAGPCEDREGEKICNVVEWVWSEVSRTTVG